MLNGLGWPEMMMLLLFGLLIFGPDQLPKIAGDLGRMIRQLRKMATDASSDLRSELGPEFDNVDLASLNPRKFIEKHLLADDEPNAPAPARRARVDPDQSRLATPAPAVTESPAPYDADAT